MERKPMPQYPIFFTLTHDVRGQAFSARVLTRGRALITFEDGQWWCSGVNPGGMTAEGETPVQAFAHFRGDLGLIYADLAAEAPSCKAFVDVVRSFVDQTNQRNLEEWKTARDRIRAGEKPEDQTIATL